MADTPTSAARPMQGLAQWLRAAAGLRSLLPAGYDPSWASEVEAVQAQPASVGLGNGSAAGHSTNEFSNLSTQAHGYGTPAAAQPASEIRECCNDECEWRGTTTRMLGTIGPLCPECGEVTEPASAPMGEPSDTEILDWLERQQDVTWQTDQGQWSGTDGGTLRMMVAEHLKRAHGISGESSGAARKDGEQAPALFPEANDHAHPDFVAAQAAESVYLADHAPAVGVSEHCKRCKRNVDRACRTHAESLECRTDGVSAPDKLKRDTAQNGNCQSCGALFPQHHAGCTHGVDQPDGAKHG